MKRMPAFLLSVLLLLGSMPALAEEQSFYYPYTHPSLGYSLVYPAGFLVLDEQTMPLMLEMMKPAGAETQEYLQLEALNAEIAQSGMAIFSDAYGRVNVNVIVREWGVPVSEALIEVGISATLPALIAELEENYKNVVLLDQGSVFQFGENRYCRIAISCEADGLPANCGQFILLEPSAMYIITYTQHASLDAETIAALDGMVSNMLIYFTPAPIPKQQ